MISKAIVHKEQGIVKVKVEVKVYLQRLMFFFPILYQSFKNQICQRRVVLPENEFLTLLPILSKIKAFIGKSLHSCGSVQ
jgi:hypothetical protein